MVVEDHHLDRDPLLDGRDDLGRVHQVRTVADQRPHRAAGRGQRDADGRGDLVAHAGVPVLHVVLVLRPGPPQLVQVAGEGAGRVDQDVGVVDQGVEQTEHLGLGGRGVLRRLRDGVGPVDAALPAGPLRRVPRSVRRVRPVAADRDPELVEPLAGVGDQGQGGEFVGVVRVQVEADEPDGWIPEEGRGGGGEVGQPGSDGDDEVGLPGERGGGGGAGVADPAHVGGVPVGQDPLARLGDGHRDPRGLGEGGQGRTGLAVPDPAARDDQRARGAPYGLGGAGQLVPVGPGPAHAPHALGEELLGPVVRLRLHVLRQREGDGAGLHGVGEHPYGLQRGRDQGLGAGDPVEVAGDGAQGVVDGDVPGVRDLQLLEHGVGGPGGEGVSGQQQDRDPVDRGEGGPGDEIGGAGADGGGDGVRGEPTALAGVPDGGVHHGLLVAALEEGHDLGAGLQEGLADAGHVPVPEDPPGGGDQPVPVSVALGVLAGQEADERLRDGEPHRWSSVREKGSRESTSWPSQLPRIQPWSGWSRISHSRVAPGPAITFR